ncbi:uncharacterized protein LOC134267771, partial [Saccostrea cucullata]|uniref:uncharacterized protein LOC134267771 n=1 Tax=Saccostrea cuccullata TaxID=36930 RepID=UPI002ED0FD46
MDLYDTVKDNKPWYDKLETAMRKIFFCFGKKEPTPPTTEPEADVPQSDPHDQNEALFPGDLSKTVGPGFNYRDSPLHSSLRYDRRRDAAKRGRSDYLESMLETDFKKENFEREEEFHENNPLDVRTWLPFGMK